MTWYTWENNNQHTLGTTTYLHNVVGYNAFGNILTEDFTKTALFGDGGGRFCT